MQIERTRGDSYADEFTLTDKQTWEPVNLAGCSFLLTVDAKPEPTDTLTQKYQLVGVVSPMDGKVLCSPTPTQANLLGTFYFDLQMTDATGKVRTVAKGTYIYTQDITK